MNHRNRIHHAAIFSTILILAGTFITLAIIAIWHTAMWGATLTQPWSKFPITPLAGALAAYLGLCAIGAYLRSKTRD